MYSGTGECGSSSHCLALLRALWLADPERCHRISWNVPQDLPIPALHHITKWERHQGFSWLYPSPQQCCSINPSTSIAVALLYSLFAHHPFHPNSNSHLSNSARSASFRGNLSWAKKFPSLRCNPRSTQALFILSWDFNWPGICLLRMVAEREAFPKRVGNINAEEILVAKMPFYRLFSFLWLETSEPFLSLKLVFIKNLFCRPRVVFNTSSRAELRQQALERLNDTGVVPLKVLPVHLSGAFLA